jgi:hypothetical protein
MRLKRLQRLSSEPKVNAIKCPTIRCGFSEDSLEWVCGLILVAASELPQSFGHTGEDLGPS